MANSVVLERQPASVGEQQLAGQSRPSRQRVYIFLSRHGLVFSINLMVMLIGAVNYNNSLAYALTFLLGGLFLVGMLHTYSNMRGLIINAFPAESVFVGEKASFPLAFNNRAGKDRLAIAIGLRRRVKKLFRSKTVYEDIDVLDIAADGIRAHSLGIRAARRGYLEAGRIRFSSTWPLGLFRAWSYMQLEHRALVYPKPAGSRTLPGASRIDEEEQAGAGSGTEDFTGYRQYRDGDSMRAVDWKAYARERGLLSKRFSGRGSRKILLDWRYTEHLGGVEARLSQLCLWILEAEKMQSHYALSMPRAGETDFSCGDAHRHACLRQLALYGLDDESAWQQAA